LRIGIVGAGAVGRWLTWIHGNAGHEVTLFCHTPQQADVLCKYGLTVFHQQNEYKYDVRARTWDSSPDVEDAPYDLWIVTIKTYHWPEFYKNWIRYASDSMCSNNNALWVAVHNGIIDYQAIAPRLHARVLRSVCTYGLTAKDATSVEVRGEGDWWIEEPIALQDQQTLAVWSRSFGASLRIHMSSTIDVHIWKKLLLNASLNPVTALTRLCNGVAWENERSRDLIMRLLREGQQVCRLATGLELEGMEQYVAQVCKQTYLNRSSMLQDLEAGRRTEIDALNGMLLRLAEPLELQLPCNQTVFDLIKACEP
jgi:2-dehydropantoate 2-reductase